MCLKYTLHSFPSLGTENKKQIQARRSEAVSCDLQTFSPWSLENLICRSFPTCPQALWCFISACWEHSHRLVYQTSLSQPQWGTTERKTTEPSLFISFFKGKRASCLDLPVSHLWNHVKENVTEQVLIFFSRSGWCQSKELGASRQQFGFQRTNQADSSLQTRKSARHMCWSTRESGLFWQIMPSSPIRAFFPQ